MKTIFTIRPSIVLLSLSLFGTVTVLTVDSHDAYAMGDAPSTCYNLYYSYVTSLTINNGTQTFNATAHPWVTFNAYDNALYEVTLVLHSTTSSKGDNNATGTVWYSDDAPNGFFGHCVNSAGEGAGQGHPGGVGPNQDVVIHTIRGRGGNAPDRIQGVMFEVNPSVYYDVNWIRDTIAPNTNITSATDSSNSRISNGGVSSSSSMSFNFSGTDNVKVAGFQCSLDNASFTLCSSPRSYSNLTSGAHTFRVEAIDNSGNIDSTPAAFAWTVTSVNSTTGGVKSAASLQNVLQARIDLLAVSNAISKMTIESANPDAIKAHLTTPLDHVSAWLTNPQHSNDAICNSLNHFTMIVNAENKAGHLSKNLATLLSVKADQIESLLGCPSFKFTKINIPGANFLWPIAINNHDQVTGFYFSKDASHVNGYLLSRGSYIGIDAPCLKITTPVAINDLGDIGGYYNCGGKSYGFLYSAGTFTSIDFPNATGTSVSNLNNHGSVVGEYLDNKGRQHGFLLHRDTGVFRSIDVPGANSSYVSNINNRDEIVGEYVDSAQRMHGFLLSGNGHFQTINFPSAYHSVVTALNDYGQLIGQGINSAYTVSHCFMYSAGEFTSITPPGAGGSGCASINNHGEVVGSYDKGDTSHGLLFAAGEVSTVDFPGSTSTWLNAINDNGDFVGQYDNDHGFLAKR